MAKSANTRGASGPARSGGGATSNKLVKPTVRGGPSSTKIVSVSAAGSIGRAKGDHVGTSGGKTVARPKDPLIQGTRSQVPSGNAVALNVGKGGPGAGRVLHGQAGSQSQHGPANQGSTGGSPFLPGGSGRGPGSFGFKGK